MTPTRHAGQQPAKSRVLAQSTDVDLLAVPPTPPTWAQAFRSREGSGEVALVHEAAGKRNVRQLFTVEQ